MLQTVNTSSKFSLAVVDISAVRSSFVRYFILECSVWLAHWWLFMMFIQSSHDDKLSWIWSCVFNNEIPACVCQSLISHSSRPYAGTEGLYCKSVSTWGLQIHSCALITVGLSRFSQLSEPFSPTTPSCIQLHPLLHCSGFGRQFFSNIRTRPPVPHVIITPTGMFHVWSSLFAGISGCFPVASVRVCLQKCRYKHSKAPFLCIWQKLRCSLM